MAAPQKGVTLRPVEIGGRVVPADTHVWIFRRGEGSADVEYQDRRSRVPEDAVANSPVKAPCLDELKKLDSCFGMSDDAFETMLIDNESYFEILLCREHGKRFLRDVRGSSAWYSRLTLLRDTDDGDTKDIWARYHRASDDRLNLEGRTL
jgi:hypothetical protein